MTLQYAFGSAYTVWPRAEAVSLQKLAGTPDGAVSTSTSVGTAHRGVANQAERARTAGSYQGCEVIWRLPIALLGSVVPRPADVVVDGAGVKYAVLWAHLANLTQEYRLFTVNLSIYLPDTITVKRAQVTRDNARGVVLTYSATPYTLSARAQTVREEIVTVRNMRQVRREYEIILPQQATINPNDKVTFGNIDLTIEEYVNTNRIDEFPVLRCRTT